jgi:hypothetical protein
MQVPRSFALREKYVRLIGNWFWQNLGEKATTLQMQSWRQLIQGGFISLENNERVVLERLAEQPTLVLLAYYVAEIQQPSSAGRGIYAQLPFSCLIDV